MHPALLPYRWFLWWINNEAVSAWVRLLLSPLMFIVSAVACVVVIVGVIAALIASVFAFLIMFQLLLDLWGVSDVRRP